MRKLNRKGFTLIELLAVIVVLAIVLVVTIPAVLSSMETAREKQFNNAVKTVEEYLKKQIAACDLRDTSIAQYNEDIFEQNSCTLRLTGAESQILAAAGYSYNASGNNPCNNENNTADFCYIDINEDGTVDQAQSPVGSKFGAKES